MIRRLLLCQFVLIFVCLTSANATSFIKLDRDTTSPVVNKDSTILKAINDKLNLLTAANKGYLVGRFNYFSEHPYEYKYDKYLKAKYKAKVVRHANKQLKKDFKKGKSADKDFESVNLFDTIGLSKIDLDSVEFNISEGVIEWIRVTTKDHRTFENKSNIPLSGYDGFAQLNFLYDMKDANNFLKINDVILYLPKPEADIIPNDDTVRFNSEYKNKLLSASLDLNSNLDFRIYTDLLGLFNKQGNGLVQTEVKSKIFFNSSPVMKHLNLYIFNYVEPCFQYSKFDSKYNGVVIGDTVSPHVISYERN
ncbi:hypothetical protein [Chitinophaga sp.]|uniref:hypothetical protein n=1 Tax=Chitinophaga sp. TaxID=1869181 RepID=UPI0031DF7BCE